MLTPRSGGQDTPSNYSNKQRAAAAFMVVALSGHAENAAAMPMRPPSGPAGAPSPDDGDGCVRPLQGRAATPEARLSKDASGRPVLTIGAACDAAKSGAQKVTASNLVPMRRSDIQVEITDLRFTQDSVSFTADSRKVSLLRLMFANDGHLYEGARDPNRVCPTVQATRRQVSWRQEGHFYHITVRLDPDAIRQIRQYRCSYHPSLSV